MEGILQDVRQGLRRLARDRGLSGTIILLIALGIGPNALVFSVLRASILRPLPYAEPQRLVLVWNSSAESPSIGVAAAELDEWSAQPRVFESVAGFKLRPGLALAAAPGPVPLYAVAVSPTLLDVLGAHPIVGGGFAPQSTGDEVVLSYDFWRRQFNADRSVIGRRISLSKRGYTVVGVMPEGFDFPRLVYPRWKAIDAWVPLELSPAERNDLTLSVVARLANGVSAKAAGRRLTALLPAAVRPSVTRVMVVNMHEAVVGKVSDALLLLAAAVAFILLLACANVANLLLTGADGRRRDAAIRCALGATRGRVARQFLVEALLLAFAGAALGLLIAYWGTFLIPAILPATFPRLAPPRIDLVVVTLSLLGAAVAVVLSALVPALSATTGPLASTLANAGNPFSTSRHHGLRAALLVSEIGLALMLTTATVLTLRGYWRLAEAHPGFEPKHVLLAGVALPHSRYGREQQQTLFLNTLIPQLNRLPGIEAGAAASGIPGVYVATSVQFTPASATHRSKAIGPSADLDYVSGYYFHAMGIPLLMGRDFGLRDQPDTQPVAIVDTAAARLFGPGPVLHKEILLDEPNTRFEVIGVVGRVHLFGAPRDAAPHIYVSLTQRPLPAFMVVLRTRQSPSGLVAGVRRAVSSIDPDLPVGTIRALQSVIAAQTSGPLFHLAMLGTFGVLALALAGFGVFSVTSYVVALREREFALRSVLGARPADLVSLVLANGAKTLLAGLGAGLVGTALLTKFVSAALPEVRANDPLAISAAIVVVVAASVGALLVAARRTTRIDPVTTLRAQ